MVLDLAVTFSLYGHTVGCNYVHSIYGPIWYLMATASVGVVHALLLCPSGTTGNPVTHVVLSITCDTPNQKWRLRIGVHLAGSKDAIERVTVRWSVRPSRSTPPSAAKRCSGSCVVLLSRSTNALPPNPVSHVALQTTVLDLATTFSLYGYIIGCKYVHRIYGPIWYLLAKASVGVGHTFLLCPSGTTGNPVTHVVSTIDCDTPFQKLLLRIGVHLAGSLVCHPLATLLWQTLTADLSCPGVHPQMHCMGHGFKGRSVHVAVHLAMELLGTLVISLMMMKTRQLSVDIYETAAKVLLAGLLHGSGKDIPAIYLNPVMASVQLFGCSHEDVLKRVMVYSLYWIGPLVGASFAVYSTFCSQTTQRKLCRPCVTFDECPATESSQPCRSSDEGANCEICGSKSRSNSSRPCRCSYNAEDDEYEKECCEDAEPSACRPSGCGITAQVRHLWSWRPSTQRSSGSAGRLSSVDARHRTDIRGCWIGDIQLVRLANQLVLDDDNIKATACRPSCPNRRCTDRPTAGHPTRVPTELPTLIVPISPQVMTPTRPGTSPPPPAGRYLIFLLHILFLLFLSSVRQVSPRLFFFFFFIGLHLAGSKGAIEHVTVYWVGPLVGASFAVYSTFCNQVTQRKLCRPCVTFDKCPATESSQPCRPSSQPCRPSDNGSNCVTTFSSRRNPSANRITSAVITGQIRWLATGDLAFRSQGHQETRHQSLNPNAGEGRAANEGTGHDRL